MTGLFNRRAFFEYGVELCRRSNDTERVSAILFDLDHFKEINDLYGHQTGDQAIKAIAAEACKNQHLVGRLGGDEICILLRGHGLSSAWEIAENLRSRVAGLRIKTPDGAVGITCSLGVSELTPGNKIDDLIRDADFALYRAKREGRDCVSTPPSPTWLEENPRHVCTVVRNRAR
jgi:diguanylate cyclase